QPESPTCAHDCTYPYRQIDTDTGADTHARVGRAKARHRSHLPTAGGVERARGNAHPREVWLRRPLGLGLGRDWLLTQTGTDISIDSLVGSRKRSYLLHTQRAPWLRAR